MATTWSDIQRLASDLQQAQLADGTKKLSEANCVEVVSTLIESGVINLVVSTDAKEYVTFDHLQTEIRNECAASGNRVTLTDLATHLRVKLSHIENAVSVIAKDNSYILCNGELLHRSFIDDLCTKVNAKLNGIGQISLLQLTRTWDVPAEFITSFILPEIGRRIQAVRFEENFYTTTFILNLKRQMVSILTAFTKSISLAAIYSHLNVSQSLFFTVWNELTDSGIITSIGRLLGTKNSLKSVFVPNVHVELAKKFVRHSLQDNGFIDCSILKKLNISDHSALFKELFPNPNDHDKLLFLPNFVINEELWTEIETSFIETMNSKKYCVIEDCLPTSLSFLRDADLQKLALCLMKSPRSNSKWSLTSENSVIFDNTAILDGLIKHVGEYIEEKAKEEAPKILMTLRAASQQQQVCGKTAGRKTQVDDDDWSTGGKSGNKKKGNKRGGGSIAKSKSHKDEPQFVDSTSLISIDSDELMSKIDELQSAAETPLPDVLMDELQDELLSRANALFRAAVERCFNSAESAVADEKRRAHEALLNQARTIYTSICAFENGANRLGEGLEAELKAHLMKTLGLELAVTLLAMLSQDYSLAESQHKVTLSAKVRNERITAIPELKCQEVLQKLFNSANSAIASDFHETIDLMRDFSVLLRQPDKTSRHEFLESYCANLRQKFVSASVEATNAIEKAPLLLLSFILFSLGHFHKLCVHASGKFVNQLSAFLVSNNNKAKNGEKDDDDVEVIIPAIILECVLDTQKRVVTLLRHRPTNSGDEADDEATENLAAVCANLAKLRAFIAERE